MLCDWPTGRRQYSDDAQTCWTIIWQGSKAIAQSKAVQSVLIDAIMISFILIERSLSHTFKRESSIQVQDGKKQHIALTSYKIDCTETTNCQCNLQAAEGTKTKLQRCSSSLECCATQAVPRVPSGFEGGYATLAKQWLEDKAGKRCIQLNGTCSRQCGIILDAQRMTRWFMSWRRKSNLQTLRIVFCCWY